MSVCARRSAWPSGLCAEEGEGRPCAASQEGSWRSRPLGPRQRLPVKGGSSQCPSPVRKLGGTLLAPWPHQHYPAGAALAGDVEHCMLGTVVDSRSALCRAVLSGLVSGKSTKMFQVEARPLAALCIWETVRTRASVLAQVPRPLGCFFLFLLCVFVVSSASVLCVFLSKRNFEGMELFSFAGLPCHL